MYRGNSFKLLGIATAAFLCAGAVSAEVPHTLTSTPDPGTVLNEELAAKARKVAGYALENSDYTVTKDTGIFGVTEVRIGDDKTYRISVNDFDQSVDSVKDNLDSMDIVITTYELGKITGEFRIIKDRGVDGRADVGLDIDKKHTLRSTLEDDKFFNHFTNYGLDNRDLYQSTYEITLDVLIEFFEKKEQETSSD